MDSPLKNTSLRRGRSLSEIFEDKIASHFKNTLDTLTAKPLLIGITSARGGSGVSSTAINLGAYKLDDSEINTARWPAFYKAIKELWLVAKR